MAWLKITRNEAVVALRGALLIGLLIFAGCGYAPTAAQNSTSREVVAASVPLSLDQTTMNEILKSAQDNKRDDRLGKVYSLVVEIMSIDTTESAHDPAGHGRIRVSGRLAENVAPILDFYFADEDRKAVQDLRLGEAVNLRGQLFAAYSTGLVFKGCVLETGQIRHRSNIP
jgi:hypothetical protein